MDSASGTPPPASGALAGRLRHVAGYWQNARAGDWWEFKIPPLLATAYATALLLHIPFEQLWPLLLLLLFALLPGAAYVSVLNDVTDLKDDLRVGKTNRMVGRSALFKFCALAACLLPGAVAGWLLRHDPITLQFYGANWVAYTLYSTPPFRLKVRGIWGIAMDAAGAHLLPTLWTATFIAEATGHPVPVVFLWTLGFWASALGVRGILWHQLYDRDNDLRGGVSTFATRSEPEAVRRSVAGVIFPVEVAALFLVLAQLDAPWSWPILAAYLAMEWVTCRAMAIDLILVHPTPRFRILFSEYYQLWYPLGFLVALAVQSPAAVGLIVLQLALFPHCFYVFLQHVHYLFWHRLKAALRGKIRLLIRKGVS